MGRGPEDGTCAEMFLQQAGGCGARFENPMFSRSIEAVRVSGTHHDVTSGTKNAAAARND